MISEARLQELQAMLDSGAEHGFYLWAEWKKQRSEVLRLDNWECQICKHKHHRHRRAVIVHHVKHLRDRPDLALSIWDGEERQLVSVCKQCHEDEHPESLRVPAPQAKPLTEERWD